MADRRPKARRRGQRSGPGGPGRGRAGRGLPSPWPRRESPDQHPSRAASARGFAPASDASVRRSAQPWPSPHAARRVDSARMASTTTFDSDRMTAFSGELMALYVGTLSTYMIAIGWRSGALDALAAGPATSAELAERAGLSERHVREWLGAMATSGIATYEPVTRRFALPAEHAACLTGDTPANTAPMAEAVAYLGRLVSSVTQTLEEGGGI